jgi:glucose/mannose-6-phosphate isomerase
VTAPLAGGANVGEGAAILDQEATYERLDAAGMGPLIAGLGDQIRTAWARGRAWEPPSGFTTPSRVVVVGMGGSAIGADIASTLARLGSEIPVEVVRNYVAPPSAEGTLTVGSSVSGNTEETLEAYGRALGGPGMQLAITKGGKLAGLGGPTLTYEWGGHPRAALGWGLMPLAAVLTRLGVLDLGDEEVESGASAVDATAIACGREMPVEANPAKQIALRLQGTLPVFVGTDFLEVAARRWAGQMQENAKQWAFSVALPEMDHNFLNGFGLPASRGGLHVVFMDADVAHPRNRRRVELTGVALDEAGVAHSRETVGGATALEAILRACALGDWVSFYLSMLNGVDPSDTSPIETFKERMG